MEKGNYLSAMARGRISNELKQIQSNPPGNWNVFPDANNLAKWKVFVDADVNYSPCSVIVLFILFLLS